MSPPLSSCPQGHTGQEAAGVNALRSRREAEKGEFRVANRVNGEDQSKDGGGDNGDAVSERH